MRKKKTILICIHILELNVFLVDVQQYLNPFKAPFLLRFELHVSPLTLSEIHNKQNDLNVRLVFSSHPKFVYSILGSLNHE